MSKPRLTLPELAIVLGLTCSVGIVSAAVIQSNRETANRIKCLSNLRMLGAAMMLYSNENRNAFPRTAYDMMNPTPTWGTPYEGNANPKATDQSDPFAIKDRERSFAPAANDVTAAWFLLLRTQDLPPETFVCPSTRLKVWDFGGRGNTAMSWTNWPGKGAIAKHLSYSLMNPYGSREAIANGYKFNNAIVAPFVIAGDMNPGTPELLTLKKDAPAEEMRKGNSLNHRRDGQNVLYPDGRAEFVTTPFAGIQGDNIYTAGGHESAFRVDKSKPGIAISPFDANDSVLLPTAKDIGQEIPELTDDELRQLEKKESELAAAQLPKFFGRYTLQSPNATRLTIERQQLLLEINAQRVSIPFEPARFEDGKLTIDLIHPQNGRIPLELSLEGGELSTDYAAGLGGRWLSDAAATTRRATTSTSQPTSTSRPSTRPGR